MLWLDGTMLNDSRTCLNKAVIYAREFINYGCRREPLCYGFTSSSADGAGMIRVLQQLEDAIRGAVRVFRRHDEPGSTIIDHIDVPANGRDNAGKSASHRLEQGVRHALAAGEKTEDVAGMEQGLYISAFPEEMHMRCEAQFLDQPLQLSTVSRIRVTAYDEEHGIGVLAANAMGSANQDVDPFYAAQVSDREDQPRVFGQPKHPAQVRDLLNTVDFVDVDAIGNCDDLFRIEGFLADGPVAYCARNGLHLVHEWVEQSVSEAMLGPPQNAHIAAA